MLIWLKLEVSMFHHSVTEFIFNCIKWNYLDLWPAYKTWPWYQSLICSNFLSVFLSLKYWAQSCEWCNKNSLTVEFGSYIYLGQNFEIPHSSENENLLCACMSKTLINCLQMFWTKPSGTATLRKLKAINNNHTFSNLYIVPLDVTFTRNFSGRAHSAALHPQLMCRCGLCLPQWRVGGQVSTRNSEKSWN